eukprot:gnl/Trimastix_PCT/3992.p1 GENE.gnl/Trimastix_PCT/3992~~gnl/Trimastix_PCT/3992.p1  ORF type:complete len:1063 (+),score=211.40 gnl/Trimastix_PCT/3992:122-3310(+)
MLDLPRVRSQEREVGTKRGVFSSQGGCRHYAKRGLDKYISAYIVRGVAIFFITICIILTFVPKLVPFYELLLTISVFCIMIEGSIYALTLPPFGHSWVTSFCREQSLLCIICVVTQLQPKLTVPYLIGVLIQYCIPLTRAPYQFSELPPMMTTHLIILVTMMVCVIICSCEISRLTSRQYASSVRLQRRIDRLKKTKRSNQLLVSHIFPEEIQSFVTETRRGTGERAKSFADAVVVFGELIHFSRFADVSDSFTAVSVLNKVFSIWDAIAVHFHLIKIKTVGDMYMAVLNVPTSHPKGPERAVHFAMDAIRAYMAVKDTLYPDTLRGYSILPRFGVHCGPLVAGTVGESKVTFDVWGDTVNIASRMCSTGRAMCCQVSQSVMASLAPESAKASSLSEPSSHTVAVTQPHYSTTPRDGSLYKASESLSSLALSVGNLHDQTSMALATETGNRHPEWTIEPQGAITLKNRGALLAFLITQYKLASGADDELSALPEERPLIPDAAGLVTPATEESVLSSVITGDADSQHTPSSRSGSMSLVFPPGSKRFSSVSWPNQVDAADDADDALGLIRGALQHTADLQQVSAESPTDSQCEGQSTASPRTPRAAGVGARTRMTVLQEVELPRDCGLRRLYQFRTKTLYQEYLSTTVAYGVFLNQICTCILAIFLMVQCVTDAFFFTSYVPVLITHIIASLYFLSAFAFTLIFKRFLVRSPRFLRFLPFLHYAVFLTSLVICMILTWTLDHPGDPSNALYLAYEGYYFMSHLMCGFYFSSILFPIPSIAWKWGLVLGQCLLFNGIYLILGLQSYDLIQFLYIQLVNLVGCLVGPLFTETLMRKDFLNQREIVGHRERLMEENKTSKQLLQTLLPPLILRKLRKNPQAIAQRITESTVLYADIVGFTAWCRHRRPKEVVETLDTLFKRLDFIARASGVDPCMTIGDCYVATANVMKTTSQHVSRMVHFAQRMLLEMETLNSETGHKLQLRIGVGTGAVISAVLGTERFTYDVFGPATTSAKLMEQTGRPNAVHISDAVKFRLAGSGAGVSLVPGPVVGGMQTHFVAPSGPMP